MTQYLLNSTHNMQQQATLVHNLLVVLIPHLLVVVVALYTVESTVHQDDSSGAKARRPFA